MKDSNKTREYLDELPFNSVKELKEFKSAIERKAYEKLIQAQFLKKMAQKEDFSFWKEEFEQGLICKYGKKEILKINRLDRGGTEVSIDSSISQLPEEIVSILFQSGGLIKAISSSFLELYYKVNGFLPDSTEESTEIIKNDFRE